MADGYLTTHVLDTARGVPAEGVKIALYKVSGNSHRKIAETVTNSDGRTDSPILGQDAFKTGTYELIFSTGEQYFDVISVSDCSLGYYRICQKGRPGDEYWVGSGDPRRLREYVERMYDLFPSGAEMQFGGRSKSSLSSILSKTIISPYLRDTFL